MRATQGLKALLPYIRDFSPQFSSCGTMFPFLLTGNAASRDALDQSAWIDMRRSRGFTINEIAINACENFAAVDLIYEIRRLRFNRALSEPRFDMWLYKDNLMKIRRRRSRGVESTSWDCGSPNLQDRSPPKSQ